MQVLLASDLCNSRQGLLYPPDAIMLSMHVTQVALYQGIEQYANLLY